MEGHRSFANAFLVETTRVSSDVHVNWVQFNPAGTWTSNARASIGLYPQANGFLGTVWSEPNQYLASWPAVGRFTQTAFRWTWSPRKGPRAAPSRSPESAV
jgi:hypothetical protein